jgi:hypothetical protein
MFVLVWKKPGEASKCCIWGSHRGGPQFPQETKFWYWVLQIICVANQQGVLCSHPIGCLFLTLGHNCLWCIPLKLLKDFLFLLLFWGFNSGPNNCYSGTLPYNSFCQQILILRECVCGGGGGVCRDFLLSWHETGMRFSDIQWMNTKDIVTHCAVVRTLSAIKYQAPNVRYAEIEKPCCRWILPLLLSPCSHLLDCTACYHVTFFVLGYNPCYFVFKDSTVWLNSIVSLMYIYS